MHAIELFTCERHRGDLRLTVGACAANYRRAKAVEPWDTMAPCKGCPIGASHAGEPLTPPAPPPRLCLRCGVTARRLIHNQLCMSCYNRERELLTGHYRRRSPPQGLQIATFQIQTAESVTVPARAASLAEALLVAAKQAPGVPLLAATLAATLPPWKAPRLCGT